MPDFESGATPRPSGSARSGLSPRLLSARLCARSDLLRFDIDHTETRLALAESECQRRRFAFSLIPARHISRRRFTFTGVISTTIGRERNWPRLNAHFRTMRRSFRFLGLIDRRQGRWDEAVRNLEHAVRPGPSECDGASCDLGGTYL